MILIFPSESSAFVSLCNAPPLLTCFTWRSFVRSAVHNAFHLVSGQLLWCICLRNSYRTIVQACHESSPMGVEYMHITLANVLVVEIELSNGKLDLAVNNADVRFGLAGYISSA
jgi:hypothetical protein